MEARQTPTFEQVPEYAQTFGNEAAELASVYWGDPLDWQQHSLDVMCSVDASGKWAAKTFGKSVPRQNGKSFDVRARCNWGMLKFGERILYTCQHGDTADEMFEAFASIYEDDENFPQLHKLVKKVVRTNGKQAVWLRNGGGIRFTTRTKSLARGKTFDVLVYDEAQELTPDQQAASLPSISAGRLKNPQTIYIGTPPGPTIAGTIFVGLHDDVHDGKRPNVAWVEWAAAEVGDPQDRERWYECNPSLGILITEEAVQAEADSMPAEEFARERLGWWQPNHVVDPAIDPAAWNYLGIDNPSRSKRARLAVGVKFSPDGQRVAWAVAQQARGRKPHVELVEYRDISHTGTGLVGSWLIERKSRLAFVEIDGQANAGALVKRLEDAKYPEKGYKRCTVNDVVDAASMLMDGIRDKSFTHYKQAPLTESALGVTKRPIGSYGGFGFDGTEPEPIEAAMLALHALKTTKRNPGRRCRVL